MKLLLVAVYDKKACVFSQPDVAVQVGQAVRSFSDAVNNPQTAFNKHPEDFTLYQVGFFDDNSGHCTPYMIKDSSDQERIAPPLVLAEGSTLIVNK